MVKHTAKNTAKNKSVSLLAGFRLSKQNPLRRVRGVKLVQLKVEFNESPLRPMSDVQRVANFGETSFIPLRRVCDLHG